MVIGVPQPRNTAPLPVRACAGGGGGLEAPDDKWSTCPGGEI